MKDISDFTMIGPLCYQGKKDCENALCTRRGFSQNDDGSWEMGECMGYHCSYCDEPCSMMGHKCDAAEAILGEARRIAEEGNG